MALLVKRRAFNCTVWSECQWEIFSARNSEIEFLLSDDPVTLYNRDCYPASSVCTYPHDPDPFWKGTRVIHPLSPDNVLVLTHSEHTDNPSRLKARQNRRNARAYDQVILNYTSIVNEREFAPDQVTCINHIIKSRAARYVASISREQRLLPIVAVRHGRGHGTMNAPNAVLVQSSSAHAAMSVVGHSETLPARACHEKADVSCSRCK
jgi:uncharacterized protein DUF4238